MIKAIVRLLATSLPAGVIVLEFDMVVGPQIRYVSCTEMATQWVTWDAHEYHSHL